MTTKNAQKITKTVKCPICGTKYEALPSDLIFCPKCGTLFEVHPYIGVRVLARTDDGGA